VGNGRSLFNSKLIDVVLGPVSRATVSLDSECIFVDSGAATGLSKLVKLYAACVAAIGKCEVVKHTGAGIDGSETRYR
jgi:hypothetical protein